MHRNAKYVYYVLALVFVSCMLNMHIISVFAAESQQRVTSIITVTITTIFGDKINTNTRTFTSTNNVTVPNVTTTGHGGILDVPTSSHNNTNVTTTGHGGILDVPP